MSWRKLSLPVAFFFTYFVLGQTVFHYWDLRPYFLSNWALYDSSRPPTEFYDLSARVEGRVLYFTRDFAQSLSGKTDVQLIWRILNESIPSSDQIPVRPELKTQLRESFMKVCNCTDAKIVRMSGKLYEHVLHQKELSASAEESLN